VRYLDDAEWHDIIEAAGPDRVSGGQWADPYAREYFRCVREDGMMVWLFRNTQQHTTDWFLHGWWD
jgi:protein ImuB